MCAELGVDYGNLADRGPANRGGSWGEVGRESGEGERRKRPPKLCVTGQLASPLRLCWFTVHSCQATEAARFVLRRRVRGSVLEVMSEGGFGDGLRRVEDVGVELRHHLARLERAERACRRFRAAGALRELARGRLEGSLTGLDLRFDRLGGHRPTINIAALEKDVLSCHVPGPRRGSDRVFGLGAGGSELG